MTEIVKIDNSTWRFENGFVRFFLLEGEDRSALIDSGVDCPDALELAETVTDKPVMLINTHGDGDHVSGTGAFSQIHIHPLDYIHCNVKTRFPETTLSEITDGEVIELGERPLKLIHIPGHTRGSVAILDMKKRVLFAGDSIQKGHIYMFGAKRDISKYEDSLNKLISLKNEYDYIYASHDEFKLDGDYVEKVKSAWKQVQGGEVPYEMIELLGEKIKSYTTPYCGFYLE